MDWEAEFLWERLKLWDSFLNLKGHIKWSREVVSGLRKPRASWE